MASTPLPSPVPAPSAANNVPSDGYYYEYQTVRRAAMLFLLEPDGFVLRAPCSDGGLQPTTLLGMTDQDVLYLNFALYCALLLVVMLATIIHFCRSVFPKRNK